MKSYLGTLTLCFAIFGAVGVSFAQIDFDRPDVIRTNFVRQTEEEQKKNPPPAPPTASEPASCNCSSSGGGAVYDSYSGGDYSGGYSYGALEDCGCGGGGFDGGFSGAYSDCDSCGYSSDCCGTGSNKWLTVSGIIDIPLDGVFHTGDDARVTAGGLGIAPTILAPATPIDILIDEMGFDDIYRTFGGVEANLNFQRDCKTSFFLGYRFVEGRANDVTIGSIVTNPTTTPVTADLNAQFSEFRESQLQAGFLTSQCFRGKLDFIWGGRMGIGFVDEITASLEVPGVVTLDDIAFYDDTTNFTVGMNMGLRMNISCRTTAHVLTGAEYRTSLNGIDTQLATLGLEELNNGSGFVSLPIYMGVSYHR